MAAGCCATGGGVKAICVHGPESSGKSTLAAQLAARLGCPLVPEYAREYCAEHGTQLSMDQLLHIGQRQDEMIVTALRGREKWLVIDTDAVFTAIWAQMMFGWRDKWFDTVPLRADHYLLLDVDLPFVQDGGRVYERLEDRQRFWRLCHQELTQRGATFGYVHGVDVDRLACAWHEIEGALTA
jgi:NadR type nicotinamide-nucleotide adenylyltransferase